MDGRTYRVMSGDGHLEPPPEDWLPWVPEKYRDRAPRLVRLPAGGEGWIIEGMPLIPLGGEAICGDAPDKLKRLGNSFWEEDGVTRRAGLGDAVQRLHEQDLDGIDAEVMFPPFFTSKLLRSISDDQSYVAMIQAYNSWLAEGYCSVAPDRLIGVAILPSTGVEDAISEMKRCKSMGLKAVCTIQWPNGTGHYKQEDDRFFGALLEEDMRFTPHVSFGEAIPRPGLTSVTLAETPDNPMRPLYTFRTQAGKICTDNIFELIYHGVFDRFPELKIYFAETHAGWLPYWLQEVEEHYGEYHFWYNVHLTKPIPEYVQSHVLFGFIRDPLAVQNRDQWNGTKNLMWGSDFPHHAETFPFSREWLDRAFAGASEQVRQQILVDNVCDFFGLDKEKPITPTPTGGPYVHPKLPDRPPFFQNDRGEYVARFN